MYCKVVVSLDREQISNFCTLSSGLHFLMKLLWNIFSLHLIKSLDIVYESYSVTVPEHFNMNFKYYFSIVYHILLHFGVFWKNGREGTSRMAFQKWSRYRWTHFSVSLYWRKIVPHITVKCFGCGLQHILWAIGKILLSFSSSLSHLLTHSPSTRLLNLLRLKFNTGWFQAMVETTAECGAECRSSSFPKYRSPSTAPPLLPYCPRTPASSFPA